MEKQLKILCLLACRRLHGQIRPTQAYVWFDFFLMSFFEKLSVGKSWLWGEVG
jgi:hypothetical protein